MATYSVLPDTLDIEFIIGDEVSLLLDFDQDLTGYTFQAPIFEATLIRNGAVEEFQAITNFTQTIVSLADGKVNLSLTENQTNLLAANSVYRWYFRWLSPDIVTRTVISGSILPRNP